MIEIGNIGSTPIEKVLEIIDTSDNVVAKYAIGEKDSLTKMLMQEHNVSISFNYPTFISFKKGYYLMFKGIKYWLMNDYKAVESNGEYRYDLVFHAKEMLFQDVQYWYDKNNIDQSEYGMTGNATYFLQLAVENINKHYGANFVNQGTVEPTDIKYIQFANNTNVFDALGQVCDTFDCEWMLVGDTINIIEKANFGDAVDFKVGETVLKIDRREGENTFDANRILALGSTLNLTEAYQGGDYMIGSKRLRIPTSKGKYIDLKPNLKPTEVKTATIIFDDIFPKRVGNIDAVREIEYNVDENGNEVITKQYRFKDNGIVFSDDYLLPNEPLMLVFETGKLAGLHFELYFSKDGYSETDDSQYYEILVNNTYGSQLPNETLKPEIGNKYVIYNFNIDLVSHIYIPEAENELFEYATRWLKDEWIDKGVYECPIMGRYSRDNDVDLEIGQRVDLYSPIFDSGNRESRVMGYVKPLISKFDAVYTIGDNKAYSSKSNIQQRITKIEATEYAINGVSGSSGDIYIIKQFDNSLPTDFNVYSAKASDYKYLNKRLGGTIQGDTLFQKNVQVQGNTITDVIQNSTFQSGEFGTGYQIKNDIGSGKSYMEVDNLRVRDEMIVSQLTIDEIKSVGGAVMLSLASLKVIEVQELESTYRVYYDNQNGELVNKFETGDQALSQMFNGGEIKRYWRLVASVGDNYIDLSKVDAETGSKVPTKDDIIVQFGHRTNVNRQYAQLISSYPPFGIRQYNGVNSFSTQGKEITRIGDPINGNYFEAAQFVIKSHGITSPIYRDRGLFANGTQYYKDDRVSWLGSLWLCLEDTKTIPSETATFWRKETSGQTDINNAIGNVSIGGTNLIIKNNLKSGYIESYTGVNVYPSSQDVYDPNYYTIVSINKSLIATVYENLSVPTGGGGYVFFYDANKNYLGRLVAWCTGGSSGSTKIGSTIYEIPPLARFYRYSIIHKDLICQIEYGNKATSYSLSPQDIQKDIDNAQNAANKAHQKLTDMAKDTILSAVEKKELKVEIDKIDKEYAKLTVQGQIFNQSIVAYKDAYDALKAYINPLLADMGDNSAIVPATYVSMFTNYNTEKVNLQNAIAIKNKDIADSKTTADEVKASMTMTEDGFLFYGKVFRVDSTLIANAIEAEDLKVGGGNFQVDKNGHITAKGANIQGEYTNISGNGYININKDSNGVTARDLSNRDIAKLGFFSGGGGEVRVASNKIYSESFNDETVLTGAGIYCESYTVSAPSTRRFSVSANRSRSRLEIIMLDLPTSKSGLDKGQLWRDGEFLKIVP